MPDAHAVSVPEQVPSYIDGKPASGPGQAIPVIYPASEEQVSTLIEAGEDEVNQAVQSARDAFDHGPWPRMNVEARKDLLYGMRDIMRAHKDELAYLECLNTGLTMDAIARHVERLAKNFEFFAEVISTVSGETYTQSPEYLTYVTREPRGVGAMIAPWNAPLALASMRVVTCIAFGNTCVLKPSEYTPLSMYRMVELMHEAGLPPGVVNLVNGRGHVTGSTLVGHPGIDMIGFTGGTSTARVIMSEAGKALKPVILELGGKSANIVFESADIDKALDGSLTGIYANNGQQCLAGSRILVQRSIAEEFIERFVERSRKIVVGDPMDPKTEIGPLAFQAHLDRVLSYVDIATQDGAELLTGGKKTEAPAGFYMEPTAVLAKRNQDRVCQEEIFGPFATFLTFDDFDEAIAIANDSKFGLVAYVWSEDLRTVLKASRALQAGTIWVNTPMMRELRAPFGGYKESGIGRDGARASADFFTEDKTTTIPIDEVPLGNFGNTG